VKLSKRQFQIRLPAPQGSSWARTVAGCAPMKSMAASPTASQRAACPQLKPVIANKSWENLGFRNSYSKSAGRLSQGFIPNRLGKTNALGVPQDSQLWRLNDLSGGVLGPVLPALIDEVGEQAAAGRVVQMRG